MSDSALSLEECKGDLILCLLLGSSSVSEKEGDPRSISSELEPSDASDISSGYGNSVVSERSGRSSSSKRS